MPFHFCGNWFHDVPAALLSFALMFPEWAAAVVRVVKGLAGR